MIDSYLSEPELAAFIATLPRRRLAAGALIRDREGRVLMVQPNYKQGWELPGGTVEAGEDPRTGCGREITEEVGLELPVGRLLVVEHGTSHGIWGDATIFLYDGGVVDADVAVTVQAEELVGYRFVSSAEVGTLAMPGLANRIAVGLSALADGDTRELVNGRG
ncbi:NUDIX hydrolase [Tersicoccus sp. MR15.9]|uniref:NUDIX hydrolase n=1 Tax=Tersicoccus mangrovi TaxID=3121635 RepID=UPI002FE63A99